MRKTIVHEACRKIRAGLISWRHVLRLGVIVTVVTASPLILGASSTSRVSAQMFHVLVAVEPEPLLRKVANTKGNALLNARDDYAFDAKTPPTALRTISAAQIASARRGGSTG
jgi:hypothetical protein